jgi:peptidyl-tRNA hydrolase, PTH2 family
MNITLQTMIFVYIGRVTKMDVKQIIVMRKDLNMRKGKMAAQAAHASTLVILKKMKQERFTSPSGVEYTKLSMDVVADEVWDKWLLSATFKKIVVSVNSEQELLDIYQKALDNRLPAAIITDHGLTEFDGVPTKTCIAIGPAMSEDIDPITRHLPLL